jgi:uncharacterized RDD family membrane protein YckC
MKWYYADAGKQVGPIEEPVLDELAASGKVRDDTLVWHEGMTAWQPMGVVRAAGGTGVARLRYAGFWVRLLARMMDAFLLALVNVIVRIPLTVMLGYGTNWRADAILLPAVMSLIGISAAVSIAIGVLYETYFVTTRGGTPGKLVLGLRIVRAGGEPVSANVAAARYFAQFLSTVTFLIGYLMAAFDPQKRALHDRICQTRVVYGG